MCYKYAIISYVIFQKAIETTETCLSKHRITLFLLLSHVIEFVFHQTGSGTKEKHQFHWFAWYDNLYLRIERRRINLSCRFVQFPVSPMCATVAMKSGVMSAQTESWWSYKNWNRIWVWYKIIPAGIINIFHATITSENWLTSNYLLNSF